MEIGIKVIEPEVIEASAEEMGAVGPRFDTGDGTGGGREFDGALDGVGVEDGGVGAEEAEVIEVDGVVTPANEDGAAVD